MKWKDRLYEKYVSSGQASIRTKNHKEHYSKFQVYSNHIIKKCMPNDKTISILDLGCGSGGHLFQLKQNGYNNIRGVDVSKEQVAFANSAGLNQVKNGDIFEFLNAFPDDNVDIILLMDVIEHLTRQELFNCMDLVFAKLKLGGKVIIHVPNAEGLFGNRIRYSDLTHELAFTPLSISQLITTIGFSDYRCFEDKPLIKSTFGIIRRIIWELGTLPTRLIFTAETGSTKVVLSQNMLVEATK